MTKFFIHRIDGLPEPVYINNYPSGSSVYVASDPTGAQIYIDGIEQIGFHTPAMITDIPPGYHEIKLISPGYSDIGSSIPLETGKTYNLFLTMGKSEQISTPSTGIILLLFALGIGFLLLRNKK